MGGQLRSGLRPGYGFRRLPWAGLLLAAALVWAHFRFERYMYDADIHWSVQLVFFAALGLLLLALSGPAQRLQPATGWLLRWCGGLILATLIFMLGFFRAWLGDRIRWELSDDPAHFRPFVVWLLFFLVVGIVAVLVPYLAERRRGHRDHWLLLLKLFSLFISVWAAALISDFLYPGTPISSGQAGYYRDDGYFISGRILPVLDWLLWSAWCIRLAYGGSGSGRKAVTAIGAYGFALGILLLAPAALVPEFLLPFLPVYVGIVPFLAVPLLVGAEVWRRRLSRRKSGNLQAAMPDVLDVGGTNR